MTTPRGLVCCWRQILVSLAILSLPATGRAREVTVPVAFDFAFLRQGLLTQVYTGPDGTAPVWSDGTGCNFLTLSNPSVDGDPNRLRVVSAAEARVGTPVGDQCLVVLNWRGFIETLETPVLSPTTPTVGFRIVDSNIYGPDWKKGLTTGVVWDWVKAYVHPRLEAVTIDLQPMVTELRALLPLILPTDDSDRIAKLLASLALAEAQPTKLGLTVVIRLDLPQRTAVPTEPAPEPTLSPEELRRWEAAWERWDAFLTFIVKRTASEAAAEDLRAALRDILLEARHDLLDALAPSDPGIPDPVRPLFLKTWTRLAPVLRQASSGLPAETSLRYLSFVAAADALQAIDRLGPDVGLDISADGLRRLARMIAPDTAEDPTAYSLAVDPSLRQLFGFGPPIPLPEDNPDVDLSRWFVSAAWAAVGPDHALLTRLNRWVPAREELDTYLPLVRDLLQYTAERALTDGKLAEEFHQLYRWAMLTTAWQETCWRQFVREGGAIKPIRSAVGSVGLMQVNQNVWRGFYDVPSLQKDIAYNARAGSEILMRYLADYSIAKGEHIQTGNIDNLARATYAVYNGGPGHLRRYRNPKTKKNLRLIDEAFWTKFQAVKAGRELEVATCYGP